MLKNPLQHLQLSMWVKSKYKDLLSDMQFKKHGSFLLRTHISRGGTNDAKFVKIQI